MDMIRHAASYISPDLKAQFERERRRLLEGAARMRERSVGAEARIAKAEAKRARRRERNQRLLSAGA